MNRLFLVLLALIGLLPLKTLAQESGAGQPAAPSLRIDASAGLPPMSPRIYSQFIEHLGRCIYGGIWAEMLEDRKFFHAITGDYNPYRSLKETPHPVVGASPWRVLGSAGLVRMDTNAPFVGLHTPRIAGGAGIRQHDLGVTQGKAYIGYAWIKSTEKGSPKVEVSLNGASERPFGPASVMRASGQYKKFTFRFVATETTDKASLDVRVTGGEVLLGTISLMPSDNVDGMRADVLGLLKDLRAPIYRWPGGNFVSGYDWRDGIGDRDRRPPRTNPAWTGVEHNDFGMDEFIRFCRLIDAEPWITVNTGFGDAHSAAAELEYANGSAKTLWGGRRAANGSREPFRVKYWGIGNEMWGNWQLGHMQLNHYILKQNWIVDTMRAVDPSIITIASGDAGNWSTGLLKGSPNHMDFLAEHFYCQERPELMPHIRQITDAIKRKATFHREARSKIPELRGKDIRIAMTEWNYWYGPHQFGELGTRYFLKDGLGIAAGLHEYARQSDIIDSAFYAQTVNVIGCIKASRRNAAFETTGLVLKLYRHHFGTLPVKTETTGLIDAQAAWSADRKTLTLGIVNASLQPQEIPVELSGARIKGPGLKRQIAGSNPKAYNDPDQPANVVIEETAASVPEKQIKVAPCSVTLFSFPAE